MRKIDLASQVKIARPRVKLVEAPASTVTKTEVNDLAALYLSVLRVWAEGARDEVIPEYRRALAELVTDDASSINTTISTIEDRAVRATITFGSLFQRWIARFQGRHMRKLIASLKYKTNVDLKTQIGPQDLAQTMETVLLRNVALVANVSDQARARIADAVFRGLQNRTPVKNIAREINEALGLGRERSLRIASDQSVKLSAALDQERQQQLGMDEFEWMHSDKKNFRPEHKARDGKVFSWSSEVGRNDPPGYKPFCGCKAKGLLRI